MEQIHSKRPDYFKATKDFSGVSVGDWITVSKNGKTYRNVEVMGKSRNGPVRRWVSARKVGMRWQPKGVGVTQLQIEGYTLHKIVLADKVARSSRNEKFDLEDLAPNSHDVGFFSGWLSARASKREQRHNDSSDRIFSSSSNSSSGGGFLSDIASLFD